MASNRNGSKGKTLSKKPIATPPKVVVESQPNSLKTAASSH